MVKITIGAAIGIGLMFGAASANALTFKSGQVLGSDGKIYDGASPEQAANLVTASQQEGLFGAKRKSAGVMGSNLFVIVQGKVTFIPLIELQGKSDDEIETLIVDRVTAGFLGDVGIVGGTAGDTAGDATVTVGQSAAAAAAAGASVEVLATQEEINAAVAKLGGFEAAAADAAALSKEAWGDISASDLQAAVAEASAHAAKEAAAVAAHVAVDDALRQLQESGASEAEIDDFIANNPAPE